MVVAPVQVKICCIQSPEEAWMALSYGAAALGFVSEMPSGLGELPDGTIREIVESVPEPAGTFLLTAVSDAERLIEKAVITGVNTLQLWDSLSPDAYLQVRSELPDVSLVQAIHVVGGSAVVEAVEAARQVDALVLDSSNPEVPYRWESQAGRTHDWDISREISETVDCPVLLAGGLTAGNVEYAVRMVRPYGVDVCSGVRTDGSLDRRKMASFFEAIRKIPAEGLSQFRRRDEAIPPQKARSE